MALINNIGAGIFTTLKYTEETSSITLPHDDAGHQALIADAIAEDAANSITAVDAGDFNGATAVAKIRDFPSFGTPANIVNVPQYGQAVSGQIGGQSDAPTLEFSLNYVPSEHNTIAGLVNDGKTYIFQLDVKNSSTGNNAAFYVKGSFAALEVTPSLTDSNQATLTLATSTDYAGPFADA
jgi:hypothetical protein